MVDGLSLDVNLSGHVDTAVPSGGTRLTLAREVHCKNSFTMLTLIMLILNILTVC